MNQREGKKSTMTIGKAWSEFLELDPEMVASWKGFVVDGRKLVKFRIE